MLPLVRHLRNSLVHITEQQRAARLISTNTTQNPVYVVFGATGGIGSALCNRLAQQQGASVIAVDRHEHKLDALKAQAGHITQTHAVDVLEPDAVSSVLDSIVDGHGRVDGVANCVGNLLTKSSLTTSHEEFMSTININLTSCFNILKPSVRCMMKSNGGALVFVSAAAARYGLPNFDAFAAAKAGVIGLTLGAASSYSTSGVRVNCVAPGLVQTPLTERLTGPKQAAELSTEMHPLKEMGEPHHVAAALEFLLHPSNHFITGQVLGVDGGLATVRPADLAA